MSTFSEHLHGVTGGSSGFLETGTGYCTPFQGAERFRWFWPGWEKGVRFERRARASGRGERGAPSPFCHR